MKPTKKRLALAALGLLSGAAAAFGAFGPGEAKTMAPTATATGGIPAIDKAVPEKLETAAFALG